MPTHVNFRYMVFACPPPAVVGAMRSPMLRERFHMTLALIAMCSEPNEALARQIIAALDGHDLCACPVTLAKLAVQPETARLNAVGRQGGLRGLQRGLIDRLVAKGILLPAKGFHPHTTLGYAPAGGFGRRNVDPIHWTIDEIALV